MGWKWFLLEEAQARTQDPTEIGRPTLLGDQVACGPPARDDDDELPEKLVKGAEFEEPLESKHRRDVGINSRRLDPDEVVAAQSCRAGCGRHRKSAALSELSDTRS
jgi:hypothetical protein